jgi:ribosomal protein L11 methylase PrmA
MIVRLATESGVSASRIGRVRVVGTDFDIVAVEAAVYEFFHNVLRSGLIIEYTYDGAC